MVLRFLFVCFALAMMASCTQIGPRSLPRDRFNYNTAIANSWKEQTLLNIVKIRYADMPLYSENSICRYASFCGSCFSCKWLHP